MADNHMAKRPARVQWHLELPPELLNEILGHLKPKDILSVCSACKALRSMLSERTVWILILRLVCQQDGVYLSSYNLDDMGAQELRLAAMGRYRWGQLLEHNCLGPTKEDFADRNVLDPAYGPTELFAVARESHGGPNLFLIPGGRYLVTVNLDYVRLVDLGIPGRPPLETPLEVAKVSLGVVDEPLRDIHLLAWEHEKTGSIRVAVGIEPMNGLFLSARVYEVLPSEDNPCFKTLGFVVARSGLRNSEWQMQVHHNVVRVASDSAGGIVWDYELGKYSAMPGLPESRYVDEEFFTGNFVIKFDCDSLYLEPVPLPSLDVPPGNQIYLRSSRPIVEAVKVPYPFRGSLGLDTVLLLSPSQPHMSFPITLDIHPVDTSAKFEMTRYSVEVAERRDSDSKSPDGLDVNVVLQTTYSLPNYVANIYHLSASSLVDLGYPSRHLAWTHFDPVHSPVALQVPVLH
ncbi:hypothetical protein MD484_g7094, partial [Candolleomyces efflorescens]